MTRLAWLCLILAACGSDPVSFSSPVGIQLKAKSGDVTNGVIAEDKGINTESGNPYGAFISAARGKIGHDPSRVEVDGLNVTLVTPAQGVTALEEIFTGEVDVQFVVNDTNTVYDVGRVVDPTGVLRIPFTVVFDGSAFQGADRDKLLGGGFKVVLRGSAAAGFDQKGADASLQLSFTFKAFE
jgi:hypothetical protein